MLSQFIKALHELHAEITNEDICDILWFTLMTQSTPGQTSSASFVHENADNMSQIDTTESQTNIRTETFHPSDSVTQSASKIPEKRANIYLPSTTDSSLNDSYRSNSYTDRLLLNSPVPTPLPDSLGLARALRPLMRRIPSMTTFILDETLSAQHMAEQLLLQQHILPPILQSVPTHWLDIALIIDESSSMNIWRPTIKEFKRMLEYHGAFRDVRTWGINMNDKHTIVLHTTWPKIDKNRVHKPNELIDPSGRRLILIMSDCISHMWYEKNFIKVMNRWGHYGPIALIQVLPQRLWFKSALSNAIEIGIHAKTPGLSNKLLDYEPISYLHDKKNLHGRLPVPILSLQTPTVRHWVQAVLMPSSTTNAAGYIFTPSEPPTENNTITLSPKERIQQFSATASPPARHLLRLLAAMPISLPTIRLIQHTMLPQSDLGHVAEILFSGLVEQLPSPKGQYDFVAGVRDLLIAITPKSESLQVIDEISHFIEQKTGSSFHIRALLENPTLINDLIIAKNNLPFATITTQVLYQVGGKYKLLAERLEKNMFSQTNSLSENQLLPQSMPLPVTANPPQWDDLKPFKEMINQKPITRQSLIKPTVLNDVLKLPAKEMQQIMKKIALLQLDPLPDGKTKKHLTHLPGKPYRIRSGRYRIFYNFNQKTVLIYKIALRTEDIYRTGDVPDLEEFEDLESEWSQSNELTPNVPSPPISQSWEKYTQPEQPQAGSIAITVELLTKLHINKDYYSLLLPITDEDSLIDCKGVDAKTLEILIEYFYPRPMTEVMQQHNLILHDIQDLQRFKEGELLNFLLALSPEQEKYANWSLHTTGPTLVKGGPGTGKSTIALFRIRSLLEQLRNIGQYQPAILFITYTNALIKSSEQQLQQLLGDDAQYVQVNTADSIAYNILAHCGQIQKNTLFKNNQEINQTIQQAITATSFEGSFLERRFKKQTIERMGLDYLAQEFNAIIIGRQLTTLEEYQQTSRNGRKLRLNATQRSGAWQVYQYWCQLLQKEGKETWQQHRVRAELLTRQSHLYQAFDAVIIDEAQDLDPSALRMLIQTCKSANRLFITADANQAIYGGSFSWSDIHQDLRFQGRTSILRANYRSTAEISEAAHSYLSHAGLEPEESEQQYINHGPMPDARAVTSSKHEIQVLANYFRRTSHELHLTLGSCAILCPSDNVGRAIASDLRQRDLEAIFMTGRELDLSHTGIKVLTLKSSKGLEFPIVALAGFINSNYPALPSEASPTEIDELLEHERRTIYVGMTRAMRALLIIIPKNTTTPLLNGFNPTLWNVSNPI